MDKRTNSEQNLHLRQSERGLSLTAQLLDYDGTPYDLTGLSARFKDAKAGGKSVSDDNVTVSTDPKTGVVTYPIHSQVFAADGIAWFEIYNTGGTLVDSTQNIVIKVEQDISDNIDNSNYISGLDGIKAQLQGIVNSAQQTLDNAVSGANSAATNANTAAQAAQALANDIPNNPKYKGAPGNDGTDGKDGLSITLSDTAITAGDMTTEPDGTLVIDSNDSLYQAETGKWVLRGNIKGSKGDTGTGIQLKGSADSVDKLPTTGNTAGDTYLVAGHLYIWENDAWTDGGELQGPAGKTPYLHTAWSWSSDGKDRFTVAYPGENLLLGTSSTKETTLTGTSWVIGSSASNAGHIPVLAGEKITYSAVITNITFNSYLEIGFYDSSKNLITNWDNGENARGSVPGTWHITATAPANSSFMAVRVVFNSPSSSQSISFIKEKLVRGEYDGIYTPNPSEDPTNAYPVYRGEYTDYTAADSTDPTKYTWVKIKGDTGNTGATGPAGPAGKSAYQVWLDAGNTGTESDYLASLKGATGAPGKDGTTPDLTPYLKTADADKKYQTATQVQAVVDAKIVPVANETTASSDSATSPTVLYLVPEVS